MISPTSRISSRGFTLLELLLAISLMGLVLSLSLPRMGAVKGPFFTQEATHNLACAVRSARLAAIEGRTTVCLTVADGEAGLLQERHLPHQSWMDIGSGGAGLPDRGLTGVMDAPVHRETPVDGRLDIVSEVPGSILFFANGTSSGGTLTVQDGDGTPHHEFVILPGTGELLVQSCAAS